MMQSTPARIQAEGTSKMKRPEATKTLKRKRLFNKLDAGRKRPVTWISGPAGSGKTELVSSYIEDRDIDHIWYNVDSSDIDISSFFFSMKQACRVNGQKKNNLPSFTADFRLDIQKFSNIFFAALYSNFAGQALIVFDNYHELPEELIFHEFLIDAINLLPDNLRVILISRKEPSAKFSRLKANRMINVLGWHDLRFTPDEFYGVVSRWGFEELPEKTQSQVYSRVDGWIAGLQFLLDGTRKFNTNLQHIDSRTCEEIFQYFAVETFDYQDNETRHLLLKTSFLANITPGLVRDFTENSNAAKALSCLNRNNLFVEKAAAGEEGESYRYHPLFREFLQHKIAEVFTPKQVREVKRKSADLLLREEKTDEAAELLSKARDYDRLIEIIVDQAAKFIAKDRQELVEKWLLQIPPDRFQDNHWLLYWSGVCQLQADTAKAKTAFRGAFEIAGDRDDATCTFSALVGLVDAVVQRCHDFTELDPLIGWFEKNGSRHWEQLSCELRVRVTASMAAAAIIRQPGNPNLPGWIDYSTKKVLGLKDIELSMYVYLVAAEYYFWTGDRGKSIEIVEKIRTFSRSPRISPLYLLQSKCVEASLHSWFMADARKCLQLVEAALEIARATDIHVMDHKLYFIGAFGALIAGKPAKMADYLQKMENALDNDQQHGFFCYHYLAAWYCITKGNFPAALEHAESAVNVAAGTGYIFHEALGIFVTGLVFFESGEFQEAETKLRQFEKKIGPSNSKLMQYIYFFSRALLSLDIGREHVGEKYLRKALKLGSMESYQGLLCWWNKNAMIRLSMKALEKKIEEKYVRNVICDQHIVPETSPIEIEHWPWPIRIYTLGRFEIVKGDRPVRFAGKAQQKPLAMLKALIALGGRGVSEEYLADALWPDADGDMQHQSLATTLHRLRKILGDKHIIEFQGGNLGINSRYVWVDIWAFERLLSQAETELSNNDTDSVNLAAGYAERAINLYKGAFLPQNSMEHWSIHLRERLKSRFLRGVTMLGRSYEKLDQREKAVECYLFALEIDSMIEEFYQRLMICYQRMGRIADAVLVYKRCRKNLFSLLQVPPSSHTRSIYKNLLARYVDQQHIPEENI